jgi:hypothetical protein
MLLERLGIDRIGIVTHNSNLASLLIRRAISNNIATGRNMKVCVVELTPINKNVIYDLLESSVQENIVFTDNPGSAMNFDGKIFLVSIGRPISQPFRDLSFPRMNLYLLISDKSFSMRKMGLETWRVITLEPGSFLMKSQSYSLKIVQKDNDLIEEEPLSDNLFEAYNLIVDSMMEFGELTVKDTINILMSNLGITKDKAREILEDLQRLRKIKINKGKIELY